MIIINGEPIAETEINLLDYLQREGYLGKRYAVEVDGVILPKAQHDGCIIKDGSRVEIVGFVGGG